MNQDIQKKYNSGRIDTIAYAAPNKKTKAQLEKELEKKQARDAELVVCKFRNDEQPGMSVVFNYLRYKGQKMQKYMFRDGEIYQIPRGIRTHIRSLATPEYEHMGRTNIIGGVGPESGQIPGMPTMRVTKRKPRFTMLDLDYMEDIEPEIGSNILEVTYADTGLSV
jgi:hypothetical protein